MKDKILSILQNKYVHYSLLALGTITVAIPIVGALLRVGIDCDSAYYICIAERVVEGYIPYETIGLGYTPLFIYIMACFKILFAIPNGLYWPYLLLHFLMQLVIAYCIYAIAKRWGSSKYVALIGTWFFLMISHWINGNVVLLETPSLFFGMLSVLMLLVFDEKSIWHQLWIGALAAGAFLSKQYGLGFIGLDLFLLLFVCRYDPKKLVLFLVGYLLPIILCLLYWKGDFVNIIFSGYGTTTAKEAGRDVSIANKFDSIIGNLWYYIYMVCPVVLVGILSLYNAWNQKHFARLVFCYCGIMGFSLQFIFAGGLHYMLYFVPFSALIITEILTIRDCKWTQGIKNIALLLLFMTTMYKVYNNRVYKLYIKSNQRVEQYAFTEKVKEYVQPGESIWIVHGGEYYLYLTTGNLPPNVSEIGYSFGPLGLNETQGFRQAESADWVIRYSKDYPYETFFTDSLKKYVEQYPAISLCDSTILLHKMH